MSGRFTRKMYDGCAFKQDTKQSTDPLELVLDVSKFVHCNNICKPAAEYPPNSALLVDVESSLWGIDKLASDCDTAKHPLCGPNGCLLTNDSRVAPHITPYACERGKDNENAVVTTNMQMPNHPGYALPDPNICHQNGNGYYNSHNRAPLAPRAPVAPVPKVLNRAPLARAPVAHSPAAHSPLAHAPIAPQVKAPLPRAPLAPLAKAPVIVNRAPLALPPNVNQAPATQMPNHKPPACSMPINNNLVY